LRIPQATDFTVAQAKDGADRARSLTTARSAVRRDSKNAPIRAAIFSAGQDEQRGILPHVSFQMVRNSLILCTAGVL
jgi:hypothetical protein